jgi:thioester reductase-like protein
MHADAKPASIHLVIRVASSQVSLTRIYELETIEKLAAWVDSLLSGKGEMEPSTHDSEEKVLLQMNDMAIQLVSLNSKHGTGTRYRQSADISRSAESERVAILTGSTGFLGSHILAQLLQDKSLSKFCLLVRVSQTIPAERQQEVAEPRVLNSIQERRLTRIDERVITYPTDLSDPKLGLPDDHYGTLRRTATHLIHAAWEFNFNLSLSAFQSQLRALMCVYNLLSGESSRDQAMRFVFGSSTATSSTPDLPDTLDPARVPKTGYAQSKLLAENVLTSVSSFPTTILRVCQLCGDTVHGIWNHQEAWPLMIDAGFHSIPKTASVSSSDKQTATLPNLAAAGIPSIDWLPVDVAAGRVLEHAFKHQDVRMKVEIVANTTSLISWQRF